MLVHEELTEQVIGAAIEVHRELGPGLLESEYEICLCHELRLRGVPFVRQETLPIAYKGILLECGYRLDIVASNAVIVEIKSDDSLEPIHESQMLTYLRLSKRKVGLLISFNVPLLKDGIVRRVL